MDGTPKIGQQGWQGGEVPGLLSGAPVPMVALAGLVIEA